MKSRPRRTLPLEELFRNPFVRLRFALLLAMLLLAVGTGGYVIVEHYRPLDALYMTVITIATVGYGEVKPLDAHGKVFTIALILGGIGTAAWAFTTIVEVFVSEQTYRLLRRTRMKRRVDALSGHFIVCGYGRLGQQIALMYHQDRVPFVVVEQEESRVTMLRDADFAYVEGDAADDETLVDAGLHRARALIAVTPTDAVNTFITLSAHGLRPEISIIARADSLQNEAKLYRAGATKVVSPHNLGGRWMGITALNPAVTDFIEAMTELDQTNFMLHEFTVHRETEFVNLPLGGQDIKRRTGALIVAVRQGEAGGRFTPNPDDEARLAPGDTLIAIGNEKQLNALARLVNPDQPQKIRMHNFPSPH